MAQFVKKTGDQQELFDPGQDTVRVRNTKTGETGFSMVVNGERRFFADTGSPAGETGAFTAAMVEAGQFAKTIFDRLGAITGDDAALNRVRRAENLLQPLREERPIATMVGGAIPGFAIPGGYPAQIGGGILEGALQSVENPIAGAAIGGTFGGIGQKVGDALAFRRQQRGAKGQAMRFAAEANIPLTVAERTDSLVAQWFDRQASTLLGRRIKGPSKQAALNRAFARSIGQDADVITGDVLNRAAREFGEVFENVASGVEEIPLTDSFAEGLEGLEELATQLVPNERAMRQLSILQDFALGDALDGKQYLRMRSQLGKISRAMWKSGGASADPISGEFVDKMISVLDQALAEAAPEAAEQLGPARTGWRQLVAMRSGAALDPQGNVNPVSMARAMERVYPGLDLNRFSPGAVGQAQRANLAAQAFPAFRSSGTSERSALSLASALPAAVDMFSGGAGPVLGGGVSREVGRQVQATAEGLLAFLDASDPDTPEE